MVSPSSLLSQVSAYIQVLPPGVGTVTFHYNPEEFTIRQDSDWQSTPQPAAGEGGAPQFQGARPRSLDVKVLLDTFSIPPNPPEAAILILKTAMRPTEASRTLRDAKPPSVMFGWGSNIVMEQAFIKSLSITYKRFMLGKPVRAEVVVSLEEVPSVVPGTNPTSGGIATRRTHTVIEGDTLASVAWQEYHDPTKWRALAEANDIDDPMRVPAGTVLLVPEPGEAEALA
ncbi:MAG: LysM peptidoglycan-binding domain-containing protein [Actinomycetota bacterium]|nr:LysM peptidoglycan-binding domain-containing protein [Actinomycetota bacterium]